MAVATTAQSLWTSKSFWNGLIAFVSTVLTLLVGGGLLHWTSITLATILACIAALGSFLGVAFRWVADQPLTLASPSAAPALPPAQLGPTVAPLNPPPPPAHIGPYEPKGR